MSEPMPTRQGGLSRWASGGAVLFAVIFAAAHSTSPSAQTDDEISCTSAHAHEVAGQIQQGPYNFTYKSWTYSRSGPSLLLAHCVVNNSNTKAIWLRWPVSGPGSMIPPHGRNESRTQYGDNRFTTSQISLLYGARETEVRTPVLLHRDEKSARNGGARPELIRAAVTQGSPYQTDLHFYTPSELPKDLLGDDAKVRNYLETHPQVLIPSEMHFEVKREGARSTYRCVYRYLDDKTADAPQLYIRFSNPRLQQAMFGAEELHAWKAKREPLPFTGESNAEGQNLNSSSLEVYLSDKKTLVATLPVESFEAGER